MKQSPRSAGYRQPAEWTPHRAVWLAWPSHVDLWQELLPAVQSEFRALAHAIADVDPVTERVRGEILEVLVPTREAHEQAERELAGLPVRFHRIAFGDIWLRDTAPIFVTRADGARAAVRFGFNSWGGKYDLPDDLTVSASISHSADLPTFDVSWILEGGSVDVDGEGTCLTTKQCLLNPNRNPDLTQDQLEQGLRETLGVEKVLWLEDGLLNDHTDGHIDTIARFVAPGVVVCMQAPDEQDPNYQVLNQIARDLEAMTDAQGRSLKVVRVPSPGRITDDDGQVMPASYVNFYIANTTVIVPTYGSPFDAAAVEAIGACFPGRKTIGLSALAILGGGGAFHCISQQEPTGSVRSI